MKAKYVLLAILLATLLTSPAFGFWHPPEIPPPPCSSFGVIINDVLTSSKVRYNFTEPFDNFCDDVTVEVWIFNVTDLYAYEFELYWDATYFSLKSWKVEHIHAADFVVLPVPEAGGPWTEPQPYKQVVSAVNPATGVSGNFKVATLVFHIVNDVCWCQGPVNGMFRLKNTKLSDSCSQEIDQCGPYHGYWTFWPVQPKVYLTPELEINWVVGDKFTMEVWVENTTKMKDIYLDIRWDWRLHSRQLKNGTWDCVWLQLLNTSKAAITINNEVFPKANRTTNILQVNIGQWDGSKVFDQIILNIVMDCKFPLINGTFKVMDIIFTKLDPWYCGRQPKYIPPEKGEHNWIPENASTPIYIYSGYLSVLCPEPRNIYFGKDPVIYEYWHVTANTQDVSPFNDVNADVYKYTFKDKVHFQVHILDPAPHYGAGFAFSTSYTFSNATTFQVWFAEYSDNKWHWQSYGTGWNGPTLDEPNLPAGIEYARSADGTWYYVTIPISYLGGAGKTYWWATQFRTTLLGTFPPNINLWAQTDASLFQEEKTMCLAKYADAMFKFVPVPGDLDGNGHVDIVDLSLIAGFYGTKKEPYYTYYDLNGDCTIDVFDIVIVAKNFCRTSPF